MGKNVPKPKVEPDDDQGNSSNSQQNIPKLPDSVKLPAGNDPDAKSVFGALKHTIEKHTGK